MVFERPVTRSAAGDYAGQENCPPALRCPPDASGGNLRWRGHDELERVFDRPIGVEEEDILRACAYVDRQDAHRGPMIAPRPAPRPKRNRYLCWRNRASITALSNMAQLKRSCKEVRV